MKRRAPRQVVDSGRVLPVPPLLLTVKEAAALLKCSTSYLNAQRAEDVKRVAGGLPLKGPPWRAAPYGVRYAHADLIAWSASTSVVNGVIASKRRPPRDPPDPSSSPEPPTSA